MNLEDHLRRMIGDLVLTIARLSAEVDTLKEAQKPPAGVASTSGTSDNESGVSP